jgi:hypothetical protein
LESTKHRLARYLGMAGIHGLGVNRTRRMVRVYCTRKATEQAPILKQLKRDAAPFAVEIVRSAPPKVG